MEPASTIIGLFGGPSKVAAIVGIHPTRVSNWKRPKGAGGTGGIIPLSHIRPLLEEGRRRNLDLTADDFIPQTERAAG